MTDPVGERTLASCQRPATMSGQLRCRVVVRTEPSHEEILDDPIGSLRSDALVREMRVGALWTAVCSRGCGLASTVGPELHEHGAVGSRQSR